jgi:hypothetical protein
MPAFHYWFSGSALFLAGSFLLTAYVGIKAVRDLHSPRTMVALVFVALALLGIGWWSAADTEKANDELRENLRTIAREVKAPLGGTAQELANEIIKRLPSSDWHLTKSQKTKLSTILKSSKSDRFPINIQALIGSVQSQMYKDDLAIIFHDKGWEVSGGVDTGLRPDLLGLYIAISPEITKDEDLPVNAKGLADILTRADIAFQFAHRPGLARDAIQLNVGSKPAK